jgi:hypothetical protein
LIEAGLSDRQIAKSLHCRRLLVGKIRKQQIDPDVISRAKLVENSRAQRGLWNGGVLPLGYEPDPDKKGSLRVIEDEAKTVRAAFQALLKEGSVSQAAKWLNQNGYTYRAPIRGGGGRPRLVVTRSGIELHYFAGVEQIKMGEALASPSFSLNKKISASGSFKYLNGAPCRT